MMDIMKLEKSTMVASQKIYITGLGGIGKTELARMLINRIYNSEEHNFDCIMWINAESESTINKSFKTFAADNLKTGTINANGVEEDISTTLDKVYTELKFLSTLIVFDNLESANLLNQYMPNCITSPGNIIFVITTQYSHCDFENEIRLPEIEESEAIKFVKRGLGISLSSITDTQLSKLVARLQYFPLAITQAIAYIKRKNKIAFYGPDEYISDLEKYPEALLNYSRMGTGTLYKKTIYQTVQLTLSRIKNDEMFGSKVIQLVHLMAYMCPDNILANLFSQFKSTHETTLEEEFIILEEYSIISRVPPGNGKPLSMNIHRLVQETIRAILSTMSKKGEVLSECLNMVQGQLSSDSVDHALSIWIYASDDSALVTKFPHYPANITKVLASLLRSTEAIKFASQQLTYFLDKHRFSYKQDAHILVNLEISKAEAMLIQGTFSDANNYLRQILQNALKYLPVSDSVVVKLYTLRVSALTRLHLFEEALKVYDEWNDKAGDFKDDISSIEMPLEIGDIMRHTKRFSKALGIFQCILAYFPNQNSNNDNEIFEPIYLKAHRLLSLTKLAMDESEGAFEHLKICLKYTEMYASQTQLQNLFIRLDLAVCYHRKGWVKKPLEILSKLYKDALEFFGKEDTDSYVPTKDITAILKGLGPNKAILTRALKAYDDLKKLYGDNFYLTSYDYAIVGYVLYEMGDHDGALALLSKLADSRVYNYNASGPNKQLTNFYIALCFQKMGMTDKALERLRSLQAALSVSNAYDLYELMERVNKEIQKIIK